ncbi:MAG: deoxyribose-phosphate aldolase [Clostridiales bacterium]|nr:deoxyribose-phosphate aldolase [Clostridiales bacterium]
MTNSEILSHVDHTLLRADASILDIFALCDEAVAHKTASVCIPPSCAGWARLQYPELNICTVIGFPLGYMTTSVKLAELIRADADGADEFDAVINIGSVKNGALALVERELDAMRISVSDKILKVIIETCYLTAEEKISMCEIVTRVGADYIKTSTGFGSAGAQLSDIELFKKHLGSGVKIKASGGIKTREAMVSFLSAGCDRLGTSSAVKALIG